MLMAKKVTKKPAVAKKATKKKPVAKKVTKKPAVAKKATKKKPVAKKVTKKPAVAKKEVKEEVGKIYEVVTLKLDAKGKGESLTVSLPVKKMRALDAWHQKHHLPRKWRLSKDGKQLFFE
jgi:hypothetical protein